MTTVLLLIIIWLLIGVITYQEFIKESLTVFIKDTCSNQKVSKNYILDTLNLAKGDLLLLIIFMCLGIIPFIYVFTCKIFKIK